MSVEDLAIGMKIQDATTGKTFTVTRLPNSRKKSIGATEDGGSGMEKWIWRNELPRYVAA